jgi:HD-like signal output (HDOD) protein
MLSKVLARRPVPTPVALPDAQTAAVTPVPAPAPTAIFTDTSIQQDVEAGEQIRRELRAAIDTLEREFGADERRDDTMTLLERIARSGEKTVRQPPAAAQRALEMVRRDDVAIAELARLVQQDPVLAQSLLRFANSAAAGVGPQTTSLAECIRRVGTQGLRSVILSSMVEATLCRTGSAYDGMMRSVWDHMIRTAPLARQLAPAFGVLPDEAFTLALLHDVGKLVLFDRLGSLRAELRRDVRMPPHVLPRMLDALHEVLGGAAALRWGLGRAVISVISTHHRRSKPQAPNLAAECVFVAERVDLALSRGRDVELNLWFDEGALLASYEAVAPIVDRLTDPTAAVSGFRL